MDMDDEYFQKLNPWMVQSFNIPNPYWDEFLVTDEVSILVVDSPIVPPIGKPPLIAIIIVPKGRETEWLYSTHLGLRRLIYKYKNLSRLIVVKNVVTGRAESYSRIHVDPFDRRNVEQRWVTELKKLLFDYKANIPVFLNDESHLKSVIQCIIADGVSEGIALVEDVEVEVEGVTGASVEKRRRMRFINIPSVYQTECKLIALQNGLPDDRDLLTLKMMNDIVFVVDTKNLVQDHLQAIVYGLSIISPLLNDRTENDIPVNVLSLGYGGGILERFLRNELGFKVVCVDKDRDLCDAIAPHFKSTLDGVLEDWDDMELILSFDATALIEELLKPGSQSDAALSTVCAPLPNFNIIIVDIITADDQPYPGACAPPRAFLEGQFLGNTAKLLNGKGALIINVISPDFVFHQTLLTKLKAFFGNVYKIGLKNEYEFVVVATDSTSSEPSASSDPGPSSVDNGFLRRIKMAIPREFNILKI